MPLTRLLRPLAMLALGLPVAACGTLNGARPLPEGEHAVGLTLGGPFVEFGGSYVPLPNVVVEGRSGLPALAGRPLDLNYGINLTALAFGSLGVHGGASWLVLDQAGARPALSVTDRLYFYTSWLNTAADPSLRGVWALDQVEVTASWLLGGQLLYGGLGEYVDLWDPELLLTPFVGAQLGRPGGRTAFTLEGRWMAVNQPEVVDTVHWAGAGHGALSATLGVSVRLGQPKEAP